MSITKSLIKPSRIHTNYLTQNMREAEVIIEPLERGMGVTLGTALRRIMLSSIPGAAITSIKIDGVVHEYATVVGVKEDVSEIILNLKNLSLRMHSDLPKKIKLSSQRPGPLLAQDIDCPSGVDVLDPNYVICTLDEGASFNMEMTVEVGRGYVQAQDHDYEERPIGLIPIDSIFSPVRRVVSKVEPARVGQRSDYDKLILLVETNGSLKPDEALNYAASIIQDQVQEFVGISDFDVRSKRDSQSDVAFSPNMLRRVEELELNVRASNCLKELGISYIGDLVQKTENDLMYIPNFGKKSLNEIKEALAHIGLVLGMNVPGWPPSNIDELSKTLLDS